MLRPAIVLFLLMTLLCGIVYPFAVTAVAQSAMSDLANGSLIRRADGSIIGSELIGQKFTSSRYFSGRISAVDYDASVSGGTNLAPTSRKLYDRMASAAAGLKAQTGTNILPVGYLTSSASGLDPHISVETARFQAPHIAEARNIPEEVILKMISDAVEMPLFFGLLGEERINVLKLNIALDQIQAN